LQVPVGGAETALDIGRRERTKGLEEAGPDRARPVLADIFVGDARQAGVIAHPLRHPARRPGLACWSRPLARLGLLHPDSPPKRYSSMRERRPQVESERKFKRPFFARH